MRLAEIQGTAYPYAADMDLIPDSPGRGESAMRLLIELEASAAEAGQTASIGHDTSSDPDSNLRLVHNVLRLLPVMTRMSDGYTSDPGMLSGRDARLAEACLVWTKKRGREFPWYVIGEQYPSPDNRHSTSLLLGSPSDRLLAYSDFATGNVDAAAWERHKEQRQDFIWHAWSTDNTGEADKPFDHSFRTFIFDHTSIKGSLAENLDLHDGLPEFLLYRHSAAQYLGELVAIFGREIELSGLTDPRPAHSPGQECNPGTPQSALQDSH